MSLTVETDPGVTGRMNISGDGLDFTLTISGNRVDIMGDNNQVEVTMTGDRANIKWLGSTGLWSSSLATSFGEFRALHMPSEGSHSILTTEDLEGERLLFCAVNQIFRGFGYSGNYFFTLQTISTPTTVIRRFNIDTFEEDTVTISERADGMVVYDDNTVYVVGRTDSPWEIAIWKIDFVEEDSTRVGTFDTSTTYEGHTFELERIAYCARCKYGTLDRLVIAAIFANAGAAWDEIVSSCVFNLSTDEEVDQDYSDGGVNFFTFLNNQSAGIFQYQGKALFSFAWNSVSDSEYEGTMCGDPFWCVNIDTGELTRIDGHGGTFGEYFEVFTDWAAMDHTNGIYYFGTYEFTGDEYGVRKAIISSFSPSAAWSATGASYLSDPISGTANAYVRSSDDRDEPTVDNLTTVTLSPTLAGMTDAGKSYKVVDDNRNMVWALADDRQTLEGFSTLVGGSDTNLSIDYGENPPPNDSVCKLIMPYKGYCAMVLYSATAGATQGYYVYLFRPLV